MIFKGLDMYESYWNLQRRPFENNADPQFYYPGESHQAALLKLRYAVENRRGGALLAGVSGSGKTLLVNMMRTMLGDGFGPFVHLVFPQMATADLLAYLAEEFDGPGGPASGASVQESVRRIGRALVENAQNGRHAVLVIDEAHLIESGHTLEALRLLMNFQPDNQPAMTLLLVGQPALLATLRRMTQLEERLSVKCLLRPFNEEETAAYVSHRLRAAGCLQPIFEPDALAALHGLTHGVARSINRLGDLSLLIGFAEERQTISGEQVEAVCEELVSVAPE